MSSCFFSAIAITNLQGNGTFGGGAEDHARFKHYGYRANSNLVLTTDSKPREHVGSFYRLWTMGFICPKLRRLDMLMKPFLV